MPKTTVLLAALLGGLLACSTPTQNNQPENATNVATEKTVEPKDLSVEEVYAMVSTGQCQAVDANGEQTREEKGIVPGAILLTNYSTFNTTELPSDKNTKLVFYCSSQKCGASHAAAKKAMEEGYSEVYVMKAGIAGWVDAGKDVKFPAKAE